MKRRRAHRKPSGPRPKAAAKASEAHVTRHVRLTLTAQPAVQRTDNFLSQRYGAFSRAFYQKLLKAGGVTVNGHPVAASHRLHNGDVVEFDLPVQAPRIIPARPMDLDILYEDADLLVLNKPAGVICHPGKKLTDDTLASGIIHHVHGDHPAPHNPGIVHRLDYDTTGVMATAKTAAAHVHLSRQFEARTVRKEYLALVRGRIARRFGQIDAPIGYAPERYGLMSAKPDALRPRPALSVYEVRERFRGHTLVSVVPKSGRTHQIRVHFEHIGHPLIGERYYRGGLAPDPLEALMPRLALHAWKLAVIHPTTHKPAEFTAQPPADFQAALDHLRATEADQPSPPG
ncbi:MAG TPA: RluA family pseudouridine synthase [Planctomycetota bacterium]|nr:RluA family pseudouridine synthase [Planctomycetota bacterium]